MQRSPLPYDVVASAVLYPDQYNLESFFSNNARVQAWIAELKKA